MVACRAHVAGGHGPVEHGDAVRRGPPVGRGSAAGTPDPSPHGSRAPTRTPNPCPGPLRWRPSVQPRPPVTGRTARRRPRRPRRDHRLRRPWPGRSQGRVRRGAGRPRGGGVAGPPSARWGPDRPGRGSPAAPARRRPDGPDPDGASRILRRPKNVRVLENVFCFFAEQDKRTAGRTAKSKGRTIAPTVGIHSRRSGCACGPAPRRSGRFASR